MSPSEKKLFLAKEWFLRAQDDEEASEIILREGGAPNVVCFLSQQIAEKTLKGFLVFHRQRFPKVHLLGKLLELCKRIDPSFAKLTKEARALSDFYISTRYPGDYPTFSLSDATLAFQRALKIKKFVFKKLGI